MHLENDLFFWEGEAEREGGEREREGERERGKEGVKERNYFF